MKELNTNTIKNELLRLGISPQLRAFEWLTRAIQLCSQDRKLRENPAGQLYDRLGQEYDCNGTTILQAMRREIITSWNERELHTEFSKVFGYKNDKCITPLEFITRVSDYLTLEE